MSDNEYIPPESPEEYNPEDDPNHPINTQQQHHWVIFAFAGGLLSVVFSLNFFFWLYSADVPKKFPEPQRLRKYLVKIKFIKLMSLVGSWCYLGHRVHLLRALFRYFLGDPGPGPNDPTLKVTYKRLNGVEVKLYQPRKEHQGLRPAVIYFHGGGWTLGSADEMDGVTRTIAKEGDIIVASVNYRLAPEHLFPAAFEDCVIATKHFLKNAEEFGANEDRIAVCGDSSGGNLCVAVALKLRDEGFKPPLKLQAAIYPCLQTLDFNTISYLENDDDAFLDKGLMVSFWLWYAFGNTKDYHIYKRNNHTSPEAKQKYLKYLDRDLLPYRVMRRMDPMPTIWTGEIKKWEEIKYIFTDPYFAPLMAKSMDGLPKTYLLSCEQDVVRDENFIFKRRLQEADVEVIHEHFSATHGLLDMLDMELGQMAMERIVECFKKHL